MVGNVKETFLAGSALSQTSLPARACAGLISVAPIVFFAIDAAASLILLFL